MPDFSILMPTYNDAATIQESIASILNQSLDCWQLIIIDDGSTDSTPVLLSQLLEAIKKTLQLRLRKSDKALQFKKPAFLVKAPMLVFFIEDIVNPESPIFIENY